MDPSNDWDCLDRYFVVPEELPQHLPADTVNCVKGLYVNGLPLSPVFYNNSQRRYIVRTAPTRFENPPVPLVLANAVSSHSKTNPQKNFLAIFSSMMLSSLCRRSGSDSLASRFTDRSTLSAPSPRPTSNY